MASLNSTVELWPQHKELIYHYYITEGRTLEHTMDIMKDVHGFKATSAKFMSAAKTLAHPFSKTQYTTKLTAWGFRKNNRSTIYPCIEGSLKRKRVDLAAIESVTISGHEGGKVIPYKKLKKELGRSKRSKEQSNQQVDAPSPPGLSVQYRSQPQFVELHLHQYPCFGFITELSNVLRFWPNFLNKGAVPQQTYNYQDMSLENSSKEITELRSVQAFGSRSQVPSSFKQACKSVGIPQDRDLEFFFQALFLVSNNQLSRENSRTLGKWLAENIKVTSLCRLHSWPAKTLLTILLHGAVEMDNITILRAAHSAGADLNNRCISEFHEYLLPHSISHDSLQCATYLINAGAEVGAPRIHQNANYPSEKVYLDHYGKPLDLASRSHRCVELIPALLARGASPCHMKLLSNCVRSGATCDTIKALVCAGVDPNEGRALSIAALLGRHDVMEVLLSAGACVEGFCEPYNFTDFSSVDVSQSPAIAAAESKCIEAIDLLIRHDVDLNASCLDHVSTDARERHFRRVRPFSGRVWLDGSFYHPIQAAVSTGDCSFVEFMIRKGASLSPKYGHPPLVLGAKNSDEAMISFLLEKGLDANLISRSGLAISALEAAASRGSLPGVRLLLNAGAEIDFCSPRPGSCTPLQRAAVCGKLDAVELLLAHGADIQAPPCPVDGISTLEALISCGKLEWVVRALAAGASVKASAETIESPLLAAIKMRNKDLVSLLLRLGADVSLVGIYEKSPLKNAILPLQLAALQDDVEICKTLVDDGAVVDGVTEYDEETSLAIACNNGCDSVAQYLISKNADLYGNATYFVNTPLYSAITCQYVEVVRLLLESGANANHFCGGSDKGDCQRCMEEHLTPLMETCEEGNNVGYDIARLLLEYGAKVNLRPSPGWRTPLQIASITNSSKLVRLLLSYGADVNATFSIDVERYMAFMSLGEISRQCNALQAAISQENVEVVELLLLSGANIHVPASSKIILTALQAAAMVGNMPIVERLLKAGAKVDESASEPYGRTAFQAAAENGRLEVLSLLLHHYHGTNIAEICDDAARFAQKKSYHHVVGFLREYKQHHTRLPVVERQEAVVLEEWINWENTP